MHFLGSDQNFSYVAEHHLTVFSLGVASV